MTTATDVMPRVACFTTNASLRPGHHVILLHGTGHLLSEAGSNIVAGSAPGIAACIGRRAEYIRTWLYVGI